MTIETVLRSLDSDEVFRRVRELLPTIVGRADEIAAARRLPGDLVDALKAAGAFRLSMPASRGGPEMSLPDQSRLIEEPRARRHGRSHRLS